jgi:hypothetical protein
MQCPHCESADTVEREERTELGYRRFRCRTCHREFNERTGTRFNHLQYPPDVVCRVVLWRVRYKLIADSAWIQYKSRVSSWAGGQNDETLLDRLSAQGRTRL